ncbi:MAG: tetratricopeptide repeat protein [Magnetococcales bacterium]|nr:tetratricopeptide repeat protein [Magnetococcales bacterium]
MSNLTADELLTLLQQATALQKQKQYPQAIDLFETILQRVPEHPATLFLLGITYLNAGKIRAAVDRLTRAVMQEPANADFHNGLGTALRRDGRYSAALDRYKEALELTPNHDEARFNLADLHMDRGAHAEALNWYDQALNSNPTLYSAWINKGLCHKSLQQFDKAEACFLKAIQLDRKQPDGHVNLATNRLITGRYSTAWPEYAWRFLLPDMQKLLKLVPKGCKRWSGESLQDKHIMVMAEQGFGDNIQFVRHLPKLKQMGATVTFIAPTALFPLFKTISYLDHLQAINTYKPQDNQFDLFTMLMDLPQWLDITPKTIPNQVPYLTPDSHYQEKWRDPFDSNNFNVGLVWYGNTLYHDDPSRRRACTPEALKELLALPVNGLTFFSLQKGEQEQQIQEYAGKNLHLLGDKLVDFADTAAVVTQLDLVITIDTAMAHLAGALGKPVWMLTAQTPDWRWQTNRDDCDWYPTMTLFRQQNPGDWSYPIKQIIEKLPQHIAREMKS